MSDIWRKIAQATGARLFGVVAGIASLALTARWLGPGGRGEVAAIITWVGTFSTLLCLSLGQVAIHKASIEDGEGWLAGAFRSLLFYAVILSLLGWLIALGLYEVSGGSIFAGLTPKWLALGFLALPLFNWEQYGNSLLMALDRLNIYNRYQVIGRTLSIILLFVLLLGLGLKVEGALIAQMLGLAVVATGGISYLLKQTGGWSMPSRREVLYLFKGGLKLHLNTVGTFLYTATDILMLNYYRGTEETGYYQLGAHLMAVMMILPQSGSRVVYGQVAQKNPDEAWPEHRRILIQVMGCMILAAGLVGLSAPYWLIWLAGSEFAPSVPVFQWQLLAVVGMTFSTLMAPQWIGRGLFLQTSFLTLAVGLGNLAANTMLIPRYGMFGAIWASLAVYTFAIFANLAMVIWCDRKTKIYMETMVKA